MNVRNHYIKNPGDRKVNFGLHEGKLFSEVPKKYLVWLSEVKDGVTRYDSNRKRWARQELKRRKHN